MNPASDVASTVEALKTRFPNTRDLYREVCSLLFFEFGITPTQNKLYQLVKRGSMGVPGEELNKFWDGLRQRQKPPSFEHPSLPEGLKAATVNAMSALWDEARLLARTEIAAARAQLDAEVNVARQAKEASEHATAQAERAVQALQADVERSEARGREVQAELESARRDLASASGRIDEMAARLEQARVQQLATQEAFSADLAKAHAAVQAAEGRAGAAERRALLEIEQERQARAKSEKVAEGLRAKVGEAEAHERKLVAQHSETVTKLKIELNTATESSRAAVATNERLQGEVDNLRLQLGDSQQARARHQAEAQTLQALIQRLTPTGSAQAGRPSRKKVAAA